MRARETVLMFASHATNLACLATIPFTYWYHWHRYWTWWSDASILECVGSLALIAVAATGVEAIALALAILVPFALEWLIERLFPCF